MADRQAKAYKDYRWIVADPDLLGGKLAIRGTRLSFAGAFPPDALPEMTDRIKVAA